MKLLLPKNALSKNFEMTAESDLSVIDSFVGFGVVF